MGEEVQGSLTPGQQFIKIVNQELTEMLGGEGGEVAEPAEFPLIMMLVGLQGSGKTRQALSDAGSQTLPDSGGHLPPGGDRTASGAGPDA